MESRQELLKITKLSYREGLFSGTSGNLSVYERSTGRMLITPGSFPYEDMAEEDLVLMDLDGKVLSGRHKPSSEWRMHAEVYKGLENVSALVHTHSPYASSFAVNHMGIPVILIEMVYFLGGDVRVADFSLPGTAALGKGVLSPLKGRGACLMANHGVLAVGSTLEEAHKRAVYTESVAKVYHLALGRGEVHVIDEAWVRQMKEGEV